MLNKKIDLQIIKRKLSKIPLLMAKYDFLVFLIGILIISCLLALFYWKYSQKLSQETRIFPKKILKIDENAYNNFLNTYQKRQERFWQAVLKEYPEVFAPIPKSKP